MHLPFSFFFEAQEKPFFAGSVCLFWFYAQLRFLPSSKYSFLLEPVRSNCVDACAAVKITVLDQGFSLPKNEKLPSLQFFLQVFALPLMPPPFSWGGQFFSPTLSTIFINGCHSSPVPSPTSLRTYANFPHVDLCGPSPQVIGCIPRVLESVQCSGDSLGLSVTGVFLCFCTPIVLSYGTET